MPQILDTTAQLVNHPALHNVVFDVKNMYGAKGDGTTDDTAAIQAAITATGWPTTPGTVLFPGGPSASYKITSAINIDGGGASSTPELHLISDGATLKTTTAGINMLNITNSIVSTTRVKVRGLYFNINAAATGVLLNNAELCEFTDCGFGGSYSTGVKITGTSTSNKFTGCEFANMARGIWLNGQAQYLGIVNCSFVEQLIGSPLNWIESDNGGNPADNVTIVGNSFRGTGATLPLIEILYGQHWTIAGNQFTNAEKESIWIGNDGSSRGHAITGNTFTLGKRHDIYINGGRENTIVGNVFGIRAGGVTSNTFADVRIANTFGGAAGSDNIVVGNRSLDTAAAITYVVEADAGCVNLIVQGNTGLAGFSAAGIYDGFYGTTPIAKPAAYTVTNPTTDRGLNVTADTLAQGLQVLGTLIADLQSLGLIG